MHAEDRALGVVFETTVRLLVPLFQRPYVWKEENNWEPLWDSIRTVADRRASGGTIRPHFLGAIILEQLMTETGEVDAREVIGGQQRLTTLQHGVKPGTKDYGHLIPNCYAYFHEQAMEWIGDVEGEALS